MNGPRGEKASVGRSVTGDFQPGSTKPFLENGCHWWNEIGRVQRAVLSQEPGRRMLLAATVGVKREQSF